MKVLFVFVAFFSQQALAQVTQNVMSESQPQYEIGAGIITLNIPDYPGSDNNRVRAVPFPYYVYRGRYLRSDDEGTRARFLSSRRYETGLSFGFNFPVNSGDNPVRRNMPDLDALMAIGPRILFRFLNDQPNHRLNLTFGARAVFSTKFSFDNLLRAEGFSFVPRVSYWYRWRNSQTTLFSSFSVEFGTSKYTGFFYNVPARLATNDRPEYTAKAGLVETSLTAGIGQQINDNLFLFTGGSWRNLDLAANADSPLVAAKDNLGFILGVVWTFFESEEKVQPL